jgi:hypothetical protein
MILNRIGKGLVLVHTAASIVALAWAVGLFMQFTDWGWKEPRSELGLRVPSEYDKRTAAFKEAVKARDTAVPALLPAWSSLRQAEERFGQNHLFYNQELARLRSSTEPIEVKSISKKGGTIVLDTPGKPIGKPVLEEKVEGITKSEDAYLADLNKINEKIKTEVNEIRDWIAKAQAITFLLSGKDDTGKQVKNAVGIYALLEVEKKAQDAARFEKEYLQPIWASALERADVLSKRRELLEASLDRLRGGQSK